MRADILEVVSFPRDARDVGQGHALDPFERQHVLGGAVPIDFRRVEIVVIGDIVAKLRGRRRLQPKIRLQLHRAGERVDDFDGAQPPPFRGKALGDSRDHDTYRARSRANRPFDAGPQHLHRDLALALLVAGVGDMHLRHRGRGDRLAEG